MNTDPARQAFDRLYSHLNLSAEDAAWHVFKSGWEAREQPAPAQPLPPNCGTGYCSCIECLFERLPADDTEGGAL